MNPFRSKRGLPADPGKNNWHLSGGEIPWASQEQEEGAMGPCALRTWEMSQGCSGTKGNRMLSPCESSTRVNDTGIRGICDGSVCNKDMGDERRG